MSSSKIHSSSEVVKISQRARRLLRSGDYLRAQQLFRQGLEMEPQNPYLLSGMGDSCRLNENYPEAESCYQLLLDLEPNNLFALRGLGDVYKKLEKHQQALPLWEKYLHLRPDDKHVMTRVADSLKASDRFDEASSWYHNILHIAPNDRYALTGLADLQHRLGRDAEAIKTYDQVLRLDGNSLPILTIVGKICWRINDFERSESYFRRALEIDPNNPYALFGLGNCFRWQRDHAKAIELWERILDHSEGTQTLHSRMGDAYCNLGQLDAAASAYRRALAMGEDAFSLSGMIYLTAQEQQWDRALDYLDRLLSVSGDSLKFLSLLTRRFEYFGQPQRIVELYRRFFKTDPSFEERILEGIRRQLEVLV